MNPVHLHISDDTAKLGGSAIPYAIAMAFMSYHNPAWFRMSSSIIVLMISGLICFTLAQQITNNKIGHKKLLWTQFAFFATRIIVHGWAARAAYYGHVGVLPIWITLMQNVAETVYGLYFYTSRADLEVTYERSEARRIANLENLREVRQMTSALVYAANEVGPGAQSMWKEPENAGVR